MLPEAGQQAGHLKASHLSAASACQLLIGDKIQYPADKKKAEEIQTDAVGSAFDHAHTQR